MKLLTKEEMIKRLSEGVSQLNIPDGLLRKDDVNRIDGVLKFWYGYSVRKVFVHKDVNQNVVVIVLNKGTSKNEAGEIRQFMRASGFCEYMKPFMCGGHRLLAYTQQFMTLEESRQLLHEMIEKEYALSD